MVLNIYAVPIFILLSRGQKDYHAPLAHMALVGGGCIYDSFSDVGEIRVYFASKILTPCRMH